MAHQQRQWEQAEQYYQHALQLKIEYNDRYEQARTYHNLGRVAQEQRQWSQAEQYYQQSLQIFVEYEDTYRRNVVLQNLARLWKASGDESLPTALASILGMTPAEVETGLRSMLEGEPGTASS